jgi:hypothetical protein
MSYKTRDNFPMDGDPRATQTYGQHTGMPPGQCMDPQAWAWWTEHTKWEAGAVSGGRKQWQRPKMTPTVRPPWGTLPRPESLRGVRTPGREPSTAGTAPGTGMSYGRSSGGGGATPRAPGSQSARYAAPSSAAPLGRELDEARAEIMRLTELKAARDEIEMLRMQLQAKGALQDAAPLPPPAAEEPREEAAAPEAPPEPKAPRVAYKAKPIAPPRSKKIENGSPRRLGPLDRAKMQNGRAAEQAALRRAIGEETLARENKLKQEQDNVRKKKLLKVSMTVANSPRYGHRRRSARPLPSQPQRPCCSAPSFAHFPLSIITPGTTNTSPGATVRPKPSRTASSGAKRQTRRSSPCPPLSRRYRHHLSRRRCRSTRRRRWRRGKRPTSASSSQRARVELG